MVDTQSAPAIDALEPKLRRLFDFPPPRSTRSSNRGRPPPVRPCSPSAAGTPAAAGPNGPRASNSARPSCSSTPPARREFLEIGRERTGRPDGPHVSHTGVHDHGFNNVSTYGNLLRLMERRAHRGECLGAPLLRAGAQVSGAVQAARWSRTADGGGYIYSFNGPHSLFVDTIRSLRSLAVATGWDTC